MPRTSMESAGGRFVDYADLKPRDISITDIAWSLARQPRWMGHIDADRFAIADHALLVRHLVIARGHKPNSTIALAALHHDSHEAYVCDLPTPLKKYLAARHALGVYNELRTELDGVISAALNIMPMMFKATDIMDADALAMRIEATFLKHSKGVPWLHMAPPREADRSSIRQFFDPTRTVSNSYQEFMAAHVEGAYLF